MFPFHPMALSLIPHQAAFVTRCAVTPSICCDTGNSCGLTCGYHSGGGCGFYSERSQLCPQAVVAAGDPVEHLAALRKQLEGALAGVDAQERALKEQQAAAKPEGGGRSGRK